MQNLGCCRRGPIPQIDIDELEARIVHNERERGLDPYQIDQKPQKHVVSPVSIKLLTLFSRIYSIEDCNKEEPTIFIILTGWNDKYNRNLPFYFVTLIFTQVT